MKIKTYSNIQKQSKLPFSMAMLAVQECVNFILPNMSGTTTPYGAVHLSLFPSKF